MARSLHLRHVRITCAFRHNIRVETHLLCWCGVLESAWWPVCDLRRLPGGWPGAGALVRIWIRTFGQGPRGAGAGQTRIGRAGGSNPDREIGRVKSETGDAPRQKKGGIGHGELNRGFYRTGRNRFEPRLDLNPGLNLGLNHTNIPAV